MAAVVGKGMAIHFGGVKVITFRLEKETGDDQSLNTHTKYIVCDDGEMI